MRPPWVLCERESKDLLTKSIENLNIHRQLIECYHDQDKEEKKESCGALVRNHHHSIVVLGVVKEKIVVLHFPAGHDQGLDQGQVECLEVRLVVEKNKKSKGEGDNEENDNSRDFEKGVAHINKHDHVDSKERDFSTQNTYFHVKKTLL